MSEGGRERGGREEGRCILHVCTYTCTCYYLSLCSFHSEFDPWDVSKQGLADLLQTEGHSSTTANQHSTGFGMTRNGLGGMETEGKGSATTKGAASSSTASNSWREELRALFPNVNISFGGERLRVWVHGLCSLYTCTVVTVCCIIICMSMYVCV